jgi:hypothetical protein
MIEVLESEDRNNTRATVCSKGGVRTNGHAEGNSGC